MDTAAVGAIAIEQITDGALSTSSSLPPGALEAPAAARTEESVHGLLDLAPHTATRVRANGGEHTVKAASPGGRRGGGRATR